MDEDAMDPERVRVNEKVLEGAKAFLSGNKRLQECDESFQALFTDILEGGKFEFLRDWFCSMDEKEDEREAMSVEERVEKEKRKSEAEDGTTWEWSESDAEAEEWLCERDALTVRGMAGWPEVRKGWEWTEYDSEAEREEAKRQLY